MPFYCIPAHAPPLQMVVADLGPGKAKGNRASPPHRYACTFELPLQVPTPTPWAGQKVHDTHRPFSLVIVTTEKCRIPSFGETLCPHTHIRL